MYIHRVVYTNVFPYCQLGEPRSHDTPVVMVIPTAQVSWFLIPFSNIKSHSSLKKWQILGLEQELYKVIVNTVCYQTVKKKKKFSNRNTHTHIYTPVRVPQGDRYQLKAPGSQSWNSINKINIGL